MKMAASAGLLLCLMMLAGCGYHTTAHGTGLPQDVHNIAVPAFSNQTRTYKVEQVLTTAVVKEFQTRSRVHILNERSSDADATLYGTVTGAAISPLTYDAQTGRASTMLVTINMKVQLVAKNGHVLFQNANYTFHDEYQVSREISSFFDEESPALDRMSQDFARTLVSGILEAY